MIREPAGGLSRERASIPAEGRRDVRARSDRAGPDRVAATLLLASALLLAGCVTSPVGRRHGPWSPAPAGSEEEQAVAKLMARMSLAQRIGQHFMGFIPRSGLDDALVADVRRGLYGGFILYPWNYRSSDDVRALTSRLQEAARDGNPPVGLFISADQEGGRVAAFRFPDLVQLPSQFDWGEYATPELARSIGFVVGSELVNLGVNMNFAPVLDLYPRADSTIIGDRSLGPDPKKVSALGAAYIEGAQAAGVIPVAKHFPGHGSTTVDSHGALPVLDFGEEQLLDRDIVPFRSAIDAGVEAIMTAHILYPRIDPRYPVTLSPAFLRGILRKKLGFNGLIISDGLAMGALAKNYDLRVTLRQCFLAGIDILLVHTRYEVPELIETTETMVRSGEISESAVNEGTARILALKYRHGLLGAQ